MSENASDLDVREAQNLYNLNFDGVIFRIVHTLGRASHHLSIYMENVRFSLLEMLLEYILDEDLLYPTTPPSIQISRIPRIAREDLEARAQSNSLPP